VGGAAEEITLNLKYDSVSSVCGNADGWSYCGSDNLSVTLTDTDGEKLNIVGLKAKVTGEKITFWANNERAEGDHFVFCYLSLETYKNVTPRKFRFKITVTTGVVVIEEPEPEEEDEVEEEEDEVEEEEDEVEEEEDEVEEEEDEVEEEEDEVEEEEDDEKKFILINPGKQFWLTTFG
jgi:hypothetical protein